MIAISARDIPHRQMKNCKVLQNYFIEWDMLTQSFLLKLYSVQDAQAINHVNMAYLIA